MVAGSVMVMGLGLTPFSSFIALPTRPLRISVTATTPRWNLIALAAALALALSAAPASALTFQAHRDFSAGSSSSPRQVVVADLNRDGFADLATANAGSDGVAVLLNDGTATATSVGFSPARQYPTGSSPYGVTTGDVNGDHLADLVAANEGANTVSVLLGKGDGTFVAQPPIALSSGTGYGPRNAIIADLNGDGKNDVATENQDDDSVSLLLNTTGPWPGSSSGSVSFSKDPTTQFPPDYETGSVPYGLSAADFNRDGKDDLVTANAYCRDGSGSATSQASCGAESNSISVLLNNGTGNPTNLFAPAANYATAPNPRSLAIGDFNEDASSDIATANFNVNSVSILLNDGQGRFPSHAEIASSTWPRSDAVGDFNGATGTGDGHIDLAVANQDSDDLNVYLGDGSGRIGDGSGAIGVPIGTYATGSGPFWVSSGDLNRDGRQDAVTANYRDNTVSVLLNSTTPPPPPNFALTLTPTTRSVLRGGAATFSVGISRTSLAGPVHLTAAGLPAGIRTTFTPNDTTGNSSTLTASTGKATKPGTYRFTLTGTSGTLTRTATGQLTVTQK